MRIAVIGGGASGIMAAITAARCGADVTIYERMDRIGKKILATGNGRCNYTNMDCNISHYHGDAPEFILPAMEKLTVSDTVAFFEELGMLTKIEENNKAFPYSLQASAVLDVLRFELYENNVDIVTDFEVCEINKAKNEFQIKSYNGEKAYADKVIIATGGKASPAHGSNGSGYEIAKKAGHKLTRTFPSLVQIKTDETYVKALKGIRLDAKVKFVSGKNVFETYGEVLFTEYGLSGPAIFNISRHCGEFDNAKITLDLLPEIDYNNIRELFNKRKTDKRNLENFFVGLINKKLGMTLMKYADVLPYSRTADTLDNKETDRLIKAVKSFFLEVKGTMSWNNAQVTAGGIKTSEIDAETMESKIVKGLYFTGEILDIDGDCGGFNLQWAWSSGYTAGKCSAEE